MILARGPQTVWYITLMVPLATGLAAIKIETSICVCFCMTADVDQSAVGTLSLPRGLREPCSVAVALGKVSSPTSLCGFDKTHAL